MKAITNHNFEDNESLKKCIAFLKLKLTFLEKFIYYHLPASHHFFTKNGMKEKLLWTTNKLWKICYMKWGVWNQMKIWSSHLLDNLSNCLMNLKNSGDSTEFEPMTSAMPVQCSNQLSYESHTVESRSICWAHVFPWKECSMKDMLYEVRCLKSNEDMILILAGQFKQLSHEPEKFRWLNGIQVTQQDSNPTNLKFYW